MSNGQDKILEVLNLKTHFTVNREKVLAVDDVSFSVRKGEVVERKQMVASNCSATTLFCLPVIS